MKKRTKMLVLGLILMSTYVGGVVAMPNDTHKGQSEGSLSDVSDASFADPYDSEIEIWVETLPTDSDSDSDDSSYSSTGSDSDSDVSQNSGIVNQMSGFYGLTTNTKTYNKFLLLLNDSEKINLKNPRGDTPLISVLKSNISLEYMEAPVNLLIKGGADTNIADSEGNTPLFFVKNKNLADILVKGGANIRAENSRRETPLLRATQLGNLEVVQFLLNLKSENDSRFNISQAEINHACASAKLFKKDEVFNWLLNNTEVDKEQVNKIVENVQQSLKKKLQSQQSARNNPNTGDSWISKLYGFCQRNDTKVYLAELNFEYPLENQLFNCRVIIKNPYFNKTYYNENFFCKTKKEAKTKIAEVVLKDLESNKDLIGEPEKKTFHYQNKLIELLGSKGVQPQDIIFEYAINNDDGTYNCKINMPRFNKVYDAKQRCRSKKMSKEAVCKYVYEELLKEENLQKNNSSI